MRFAYLIMGQFHAAVDQAEICNDQDWAQLAGAANLEEAVEAARCLQREGVEWKPDSHRICHAPSGTGGGLPGGFSGGRSWGRLRKILFPLWHLLSSGFVIC